MNYTSVFLPVGFVEKERELIFQAVLFAAGEARPLDVSLT